MAGVGSIADPQPSRRKLLFMPRCGPSGPLRTSDDPCPLTRFRRYLVLTTCGCIQASLIYLRDGERRHALRGRKGNEPSRYSCCLLMLLGRKWLYGDGVLAPTSVR